VRKSSHASRIREYVCSWLHLRGGMRHRSNRCLGLTRRRVGEEFEKIGVGAADGEGPARP